MFWTLLGLRLVDALTMTSYFQPDEYYQALEPAWQMAFGRDSGAWLTWVCMRRPRAARAKGEKLTRAPQDWQHQLRSSLHPALFAAAYVVTDRVARLLPLAYLPLGHKALPQLLIAAPKVVQAVVAAAEDRYTWQLAVRLFGPDSTASWFAVRRLPCPSLSPACYMASPRQSSTNPYPRSSP